MEKNILLCGVGGQGTVLASRLIALAAMEKGLDARTAETIGMAQRGGSVFSHVRIGEQVFSPLIPYGQADAIIGFEPGETLRCFPYLKKDGVIVVSKKAVKPVTATLSTSDYDGSAEIAYLQQHHDKVVVFDTEEALKECGSGKVLNVLLLGALIAHGDIGITLEEMQHAIEKKVPERFRELNQRALAIGAAL